VCLSYDVLYVCKDADEYVCVYASTSSADRVFMQGALCQQVRVYVCMYVCMCMCKQCGSCIYAQHSVSAGMYVCMRVCEHVNTSSADSVTETH
jgi:hypothetical protein